MARLTQASLFTFGTDRPRIAGATVWPHVATRHIGSDQAGFIPAWRPLRVAPLQWRSSLAESWAAPAARGIRSLGASVRASARASHHLPTSYPDNFSSVSRTKVFPSMSSTTRRDYTLGPKKRSAFARLAPKPPVPTAKSDRNTSKLLQVAV